MADTGDEGAAAAAAADYPADALADLAVSILGGLEANRFDAPTALSSAPSSTRAVRAQRGCCVVQVLPEAPLAVDMPFYFGKDRAGYVLVSPRTELPGWPTTSGGPRVRVW